VRVFPRLTRAPRRRSTELVKASVLPTNVTRGTRSSNAAAQPRTVPAWPNTSVASDNPIDTTMNSPSSKRSPCTNVCVHCQQSHASSKARSCTAHDPPPGCQHTLPLRTAICATETLSLSCSRWVDVPAAGSVRPAEPESSRVGPSPSSEALEQSRCLCPSRWWTCRGLQRGSLHPANVHPPPNVHPPVPRHRSVAVSAAAQSGQTRQLLAVAGGTTHDGVAGAGLGLGVRPRGAPLHRRRPTSTWWVYGRRCRL